MAYPNKIQDFALILIILRKISGLSGGFGPNLYLHPILIERDTYDLAIFDVLYIGQCDNLMRYLSHTGTRSIVVVNTQKEERYYTSSQRILNIRILNIKEVFKKPITPEYYHLIINEIANRC